MQVQEMETRLALILRERDGWERKRKMLQIAAHVARLEEDEESVQWFERQYLAAHTSYEEACRSLNTEEEEIC